MPALTGSTSRRRALVGSTAAVTMVVALASVMVPLRAHLSVATTALVLVLPVVVGVSIGGFPAGMVATVTGFLVYDFVFIPPYYTLSVGATQNWTALCAYALVMVVVARVMSGVKVARAEAQLRAAEVRRLFDLSELLVRSPEPELLETIVVAVRHAFDLDGAALLLPKADHLDLVASSGVPLSALELRQLSTSAQGPVSLDTAVEQRGGVRVLALSASGKAIGLLALRGLPPATRGHELLRAFANHLALALERGQLNERAVRAQLLEEIDRLRRSLVGAVSHDLRTPLATIKVSTSTLLDPDASVSDPDAKELIGLIDAQADRLNRLVSNLLDMTRIQSGTLELRRHPVAVGDLVSEALAVLGHSVELDRVQWKASVDLPLVEVDHVLICQVLANLVDNAVRHAPGETPITISAMRHSEGRVLVSVIDRGPGVPSEDRANIFEMFNRREAGGRGGLGLAIARAFVEAHGQRIWVEDGREIGARFALTLPTAAGANRAEAS